MRAVGFLRAPALAGRPPGSGVPVSRMYSLHSLNVIRIAAAAGMARMAHITPNRVEPKSTATSTTKGSISVARFWIWGWIT